ncbi:hypothetical protein ACHAW6_012252, partial [Cyclotella cf. meneghiniana]
DCVGQRDCDEQPACLYLLLLDPTQQRRQDASRRRYRPRVKHPDAVENCWFDGATTVYRAYFRPRRYVARLSRNTNATWASRGGRFVGDSTPKRERTRATP